MKKGLSLGIALTLVAVNSYGSGVIVSSDEMRLPPREVDVFLGSPLHTFQIEFAALFLQPTASNLHYAAEATPLPVPSPNWLIHEVDTDYKFGFDLGCSGVFHDLNTYMRINWEHFHNSDSTAVTVSSSNMIGPFFEIGPDASFFKQSSGKATFHFDEVNLDYGIFINFGDRLQTNWFTGISYARIKQTLYSTFSNPEETIVRTLDVPSTFQGAGPQFGLDFSYRIVKGLQLTGEAVSAMLVGPLNNNTTYQTFAPDLVIVNVTPPNVQTTTVQKQMQLVPAIEGKLGLAYWVATEPCRLPLTMRFEFGYQGQIYLNAIQSIDMGSEVLIPPLVPNTIGVYARSFQQTLSNFALAGPYLRFDFGF